MTSKSNKNHRRREKKRNLIRRQLYQNRRECAELIRAIRYMRIRNEEVAMLNFLSRVQFCIRRVSLSTSLSLSSSTATAVAATNNNQVSSSSSSNSEEEQQQQRSSSSSSSTRQETFQEVLIVDDHEKARD